jgi:hypothetical protein
MTLILAAVTAALVELVPIEQPKGVPPPSFEVGGYREDGSLTRAPLLVPGQRGHDDVRIAFRAPIDGQCGIAQVVEMKGRAMMTLLRVSAVNRGQVQFVEVQLGTPAEIADAGATSPAPTVVVVCFVPETPSATRYSRIFRSTAKPIES